jgi:hypothetical protein
VSSPVTQTINWEKLRTAEKHYESQFNGNNIYSVRYRWELTLWFAWAGRGEGAAVRRENSLTREHPRCWIVSTAQREQGRRIYVLIILIKLAIAQICGNTLVVCLRQYCVLPLYSAGRVLLIANNAAGVPSKEILLAVCACPSGLTFHDSKRPMHNIYRYRVNREAFYNFPDLLVVWTLPIVRFCRN